MKKLEKIVDKIKYHLVDSTAMLAASHPFFSALETKVVEMSNEVSINSRLYITGLSYAGLGYVVSKGRDLSRDLFDITQKTKEKIQNIHDSIYLAAVNIPITSTLYMTAGETNFKKILVGTAMSSVFGLVMGQYIGYSIDFFRDLTNLNKCERKIYPNCLRKLKPAVKKGIALLLTSASIGAMAFIYSINKN